MLREPCRRHGAPVCGVAFVGKDARAVAQQKPTVESRSARARQRSRQQTRYPKSRVVTPSKRGGQQQYRRRRSRVRPRRREPGPHQTRAASRELRPQKKRLLVVEVCPASQMWRARGLLQQRMRGRRMRNRAPVTRHKVRPPLSVATDVPSEEMPHAREVQCVMVWSLRRTYPHRV